MSVALRRQIGQLVVAGFAGRSLPVELRAIARAFELGGVILFGRNVEAPMQVAEVAYEVGRLPGELPAWVSVDQEGGRVQRLGTPWTDWPPMSTLGRGVHDPDLHLADRFGRALARELRAVGVTLDYAPVLDVATNPGNPVIGDRAISAVPERVAAVGAAIVQALQDEGVAACGKHFPGHGDTALDSHEDLPVVEADRPRIEAVELVPFRAAIASGVAAVMTAHVCYPALDDTGPATLSSRIVGDLLRTACGFEGLVVTDDLAMGAIAKHHDVGEAAVAALRAGCDLLLLCDPDPGGQVAVLERIIHAVEDETLPVSRVDDALARGRRAKERFLAARRDWRPPSERALRLVLGNGEHRAVAEAMRGLEAETPSTSAHR